MNTGFMGASSSSPYFTASVDGSGQIIAYEASGQRVVGVTAASFDDMKSQRDKALAKAEELYRLCVDNGLLTPEPTQEELLRQAISELQETKRINREMMDANAKMMELIDSLTSATAPARQKGAKERNANEH